MCENESQREVRGRMKACEAAMIVFYLSDSQEVLLPSASISFSLSSIYYILIMCRIHVAHKDTDTDRDRHNTHTHTHTHTHTGEQNTIIAIC